jgi:hypothetical protein
MSVDQGSMITDAILDRIDAGGGGALSRIHVHSALNITQNGYICQLVVDEVVGTDLTVEDDPDGDPGNAKYVMVHTPGLYVAQMQLVSSAPNVHGVSCHPNFTDFQVALVTIDPQGGWYWGSGIQGDFIGATTHTYWKASGPYVLDVQSDDVETSFGNAGADIYRIH